jgi:pimeloyl-ACP methyl ester carboxylesterase
MSNLNALRVVLEKKYSSKYSSRLFFVVKWVGLPLLLIFAFKSMVETVELAPQVTYTFEEHCRKYNYPFEEYNTTTDDGYILSIYRIPRSGPPVLLIHGLSNSANCFIINQCSSPPGFILADNNYDVWLGNLRGTHLSRGHKHLDASKEEYWDWSFTEIIQYDLPALVKFVKKVTGYNKIGLLGHSQGGASILWALARYPEVFDPDVAIGILLATPGGVINSNSIYLNFLSSGLFHEFCSLLGVNVISDWTDDTFLAKFVRSFPSVSTLIAKDLYDIDMHGGNAEDMAVYLHRIRGGTSLKNLMFWSQVKHNKLVSPRLYDNGEEENLKKYNSKTPPQVNFSDILTKVAIFNGKYDKAVPIEDSRILRDSINKDALVHYDDNYIQDHAGFLFACDMSYFDDVLSVLHKHLKYLDSQ